MLRNNLIIFLATRRFNLVNFDKLVKFIIYYYLLGELILRKDFIVVYERLKGWLSPPVPLLQISGFCCFTHFVWSQ